MSQMLSSRVAEEPPEAQRQAGDLAAFRRMLQISEGTFSLSFAICDDRRLRDSLIKRFRDEMPGILVVTLPAGVESVLRFVESQITDTPPAAVFILDIEASIPFGSESQPALRVLNASRERWEKLRCPVVFWLAEYAITLLHTHAPDFWRYRSHQFEFVPEPVPLNQLTEEGFSGFPMVDALPFEEKAFRIIELERRLRDAGDPPVAELLPHVLTWTNELAYLYRHAGRYQEAEASLRHACIQAEKTFGPDHPETAVALNNIAVFLQAVNRLDEAELLLRRALRIDESHYGLEHSIVARDLNNVAAILGDSNRLEEAELLIRRALLINEAIYGASHPTVARSLSNLAQLLQASNRLEEAELLMRQVLHIDINKYGEGHPVVAIRLNNLAGLLQVTKRQSEAEPLMRRALRIDEACYGQEHPDVARDLNNLAQILHDTNRLVEAELLMRRALLIDEACYGSEHPDVARDLNNLAQVLHDTNRLPEAESLARRALQIFMRNLTNDHPKIQTALHNYTSLLQAMKFPESEIQQRVKEAIEGGTSSPLKTAPSARPDLAAGGMPPH